MALELKNDTWVRRVGQALAADPPASMLWPLCEIGAIGDSRSFPIADCEGGGGGLVSPAVFKTVQPG